MIKNLFTNRLFVCWTQQLFNTSVLCMVFIFLEWVFFLTKPSFLDALDSVQKIIVLFKGSIFFSGLCLIALLLIGIISLCFRWKKPKLFLDISISIPAAIFAVLILLIIDNFTYTVFRFGIATSIGFWRIFYTLILLGLFALGFIIFSFSLTLRIKNVGIKCISIGLLLALFFLIVPINKQTTRNDENLSSDLPNIILFGTDGLSADHMSIYGYDRETTPYLSRLEKESLIVENNFTNSSETSGSIISILTGRYPTQTRVLYPPDVLTGKDAQQHLPGILKTLGYYNIELSFPHYADAFTLGMLKGFDIVNGNLAVNNTYLQMVGAGLPMQDSLFLSSLVERVSARIKHIFFIKPMINWYDAILQNPEIYPDEGKIKTALAFFDSHQEQPLFIHIHLLGTHGPRFSIGQKIFSKGLEQNQDWMTDFYDDSILEIDRLFGELLLGLEQRGKLENTVIIFYSDHGMQWEDDVTIPLIFHFPGKNFGNMKIHQAENLDIAPTILDYLDIERPEWLMGHSLIDSAFTDQPVVSTGTDQIAFRNGFFSIKPDTYKTQPFYQFDYIRVTYCQAWYRLDLNTYEFSHGEVYDFQEPCEVEALLSQDKAANIILDRLQSDGFDVPSPLLELLE